ncbi:MAG: desulfoferrodoxin family protein [Erysipelotrichia bacterium]|nr:desulfoferrodoxin family protein [Erysipelotrichia bacterium]
MKIYRCSICGNIIVKLSDSGVTPTCCGEEMVLLKANTTDGALEKHVPQVKLNENHVEVQIGEVIHPMIETHYIEWVLLETDKGFQVKYLKPQQEPRCCFELGDEKLLAVYEYCNLHGLWKKEM